MLLFFSGNEERGYAFCRVQARNLGWERSGFKRLHRLRITKLMLDGSLTNFWILGLASYRITSHLTTLYHTTTIHWKSLNKTTILSAKPSDFPYLLYTPFIFILSYHCEELFKVDGWRLFIQPSLLNTEPWSLLQLSQNFWVNESKKEAHKSYFCPGLVTSHVGIKFGLTQRKKEHTRIKMVTLC